ncbi:MAG: arginine--tRNA ligase, partial [Eubacterium sp.]|nr:arginine--tRNA ligase [Eubacterium sp.]
YMGNNVIGDVHLGDWGLQMGLIIMELKSRKPDLPYFDEDFDGEYPKEAPFDISELEDIYPAASAKAAEDEEFKEAAGEATRKLQDGYKPYRAIWNHIMDVSLADLKKNYDRLDTHFDLWKGESDANPYIDDLIQELVDKGLAFESEGALVVDIKEDGDKKEYPPCIVRKSDGAALYATSDLGTIIEREKLYEPDEYIYITDKRQELHFTQVFRVAKKAGFVTEDRDMNFIGFGTVNGKDGKPFKTRDGGVYRLEYLIDDINEAVYNKMKENKSLDDAEAKKVSEIVGLAALKYGDLSNQANKDYIFDLEKFASFEGNTGPYILYTIVRIKSILEKYKAEGGSVDGLEIKASDNETQNKLMLEISKVNEVIESAAEELAPHRICQYIYELSNVFNSFYHNTKILAEEDEEKKKGYIALLELTKKVLETGIDLLGFSAPDKM